MGQIFVAILAGVCSKKVDSYGYGAIGKFNNNNNKNNTNYK